MSARPARTAWLVQANRPPGSTAPAALRRACAETGHAFHPFEVMPGAAALSGLPDVAGPAVLHGGTTLIVQACEHPRWRRGIFFEPSRFRHAAYAAAWGEAVLNADARIMTWGRFLATAHPEQLVFVKPNDDLKAFGGRVRRPRDWAQVDRQHPLDPATEIVVAPVREIDAEWRLFVVAGEIVTGAMYRPSDDARLPADLVRFAESVIARWTPADVFVLDVARVEGCFKVVECNCFNGSRFYAADVARLVGAVSAYRERLG